MSQDLVGQIGYIRNLDKTGFIKLRILSVDNAKKCEACGGPQGLVEVVETCMISASQIVLAGKRTYSCLNDIKFPQDPELIELKKP
jgi:hypothetical protein